mgnify:CR=1 FL=1
MSAIRTGLSGNDFILGIGIGLISGLGSGSGSSSGHSIASSDATAPSASSDALVAAASARSAKRDDVMNASARAPRSPWRWDPPDQGSPRYPYPYFSRGGSRPPRTPPNTSSIGAEGPRGGVRGGQELPWEKYGHGYLGNP